MRVGVADRGVGLPRAVVDHEGEHRCASAMASSDSPSFRSCATSAASRLDTVEATGSCGLRVVVVVGGGDAAATATAAARRYLSTPQPPAARIQQPMALCKQNAICVGPRRVPLKATLRCRHRHRRPPPPPLPLLLSTSPTSDRPPLLPQVVLLPVLLVLVLGLQMLGCRRATAPLLLWPPPPSRTVVVVAHSPQPTYHHHHQVAAAAARFPSSVSGHTDPCTDFRSHSKLQSSLVIIIIV